MSIIIGNNISKYRKSLNLTQLELSQKINYSDKSISKWEKGDGIPDIIVLKKLADIFNVTVNELIDEGSVINTKNVSKRPIITSLSILLVWLVAVFCFVVLFWIDRSIKSWLAFVYALPATFIVAQVFSSMWGNKFSRAFCFSGIVWSTIISISITINLTHSFMLLLVGIPLQVMIILWYVFIAKEKNK